MNKIKQLNQMTTREIAAEARLILLSNSYHEAEVLLKNHIEIANAKMKEFSKIMNKKYNKNKAAPKINVITDFLRFR